MLILILLISIPVIEIWLFIETGGAIGGWNVFFLTILTAFIGMGLLKIQGLSTLAAAQKKIEADEAPVSELFDGICMFLAGVFLLIPGFMTDFFGFLLFFPPFRGFLRKRFKEIPAGMMHQNFSSATFFTMQQEQNAANDPSSQSDNRASGQGRRGQNNTVIDGDYIDVTDAQDDASPVDPDKKP